MWLWIALMGSLGWAQDVEQKLTWSIRAGGSEIGHRDVTVKFVKTDAGVRRIIESWTELDGAVGPIPVSMRQRMTVHAAGRDPGSFHSVMEFNGVPQEVQARWTAAAWWVTTNVNGNKRTVDIPVSQVNISTADLMDPDSGLPLSRFDDVRILSAETGEILTGPVEDLGLRSIQVGSEEVQAHGYGWKSPAGRSVFYFSSEGHLVEYSTKLMGIDIQGVLTEPPPPGLDDFPVAVGGPSVEKLPLD